MTNPTPTSGAADRCQACVDRNDGFYGSYAPQCPAHNDDGTPRETALANAPQPALTAQAISKAPDHIAEVGNMVAQAISAEPAGAGYATWPEPEVHDEGGWHITYYTATMMRDFADRTHALRATHGQAPAQTADFTTLGATMRAIQQAIELIGAPTDERMRAVRRVLRGAVVVAEDSGDIPAQPAPPAMDSGEDAEQERPVQRMDGWTDTRYITELENVVRLLRRDLEKLHKVREALSDCSGGQPCSTCPDKKACQRGCVRQEEFISTEYHAQQRSRAAQQAPAGVADPRQQHMANQAEVIDCEALQRAMVQHGISFPEGGMEYFRASLGEMVNRFVRFAAPTAPSMPASPTIEGESK